MALKQLLRWRAHEHVRRTRAVGAACGPSCGRWRSISALIFALGIYVASVVLIGYFMLRHGKHGVALTAAVSLGVPLFFFLVFERWFLVALPKGPLEALFGF